MDEARKKLLESMTIEVLDHRFDLRRDGDDMFQGEIYADYRDEIDGRTVGEILDSDDPDLAFVEKLEEWYGDAEGYYKQEVTKDVKHELEKDEVVFPNGIDEEEDDFIEEFVRDNICCDYPADHFLNQEQYVNIMVDTGDCNHDFVLNSVYPCWYGEYGERIDNRAGIVWLAKTQGYTKTQLWKALKDGDMAEPNGFLESMRVELSNLPSHMSTVTFLVKMTFRQLLTLNGALRWRERQGGRKYDPKEYPDSGYIVLSKDTMCGLYDPWSGSGSVLEVQLEKDVRLPVKYIWLAIPDEAKGHGYQIGEVYGMCGSAWQDTLKEMHFPRKMMEATA